MAATVAVDALAFGIWGGVGNEDREGLLARADAHDLLLFLRTCVARRQAGVRPTAG